MEQEVLRQLAKQALIIYMRNNSRLVRILDRSTDGIYTYDADTTLLDYYNFTMLLNSLIQDPNIPLGLEPNVEQKVRSAVKTWLHDDNVELKLGGKTYSRANANLPALDAISLGTLLRVFHSVVLFKFVPTRRTLGDKK